MSENPFVAQAQQNAPFSAFIMATVKAVYANEGATLLIAGESVATQKRYKALNNATLKANDRVLCAELSGSYVILGVVP